jgi:hypothetical protein
MSRFYRELHDRELLTHGEHLLQEIQRRNLLEVTLPPEDEANKPQDLIFPRRLASVAIHNGKLKLAVEQSFFRSV